MSAEQHAAVLIGIVTRDRAGILPKSIESALSQRGVPIRISVIDDGSRDETPEIAKHFPLVEWITRKESRGYMAARNHWMNNATADYFVSLDDDAWFLAGDEIALACAVMDENPRIGAIGFDILSPDRPETKPRSGTERISSFIGCGHMVRLSAVKQVGGYEETPGSYGAEEKDLCLRLLDDNYEVVRLNGVHVWHDKTQIARQPNAQYRSGVCNDLVMAVRRTPILLLPAALLSKFCRHLLFGVRKQLLRPALAGFTLFFKVLPAVWRSRKPVKASTLRTFMQLRAR
jgi:glycosyltransferase involved in cell wall biosynthesis